MGVEGGEGKEEKKREREKGGGKQGKGERGRERGGGREDTEILPRAA